MGKSAETVASEEFQDVPLPDIPDEALLPDLERTVTSILNLIDLPRCENCSVGMDVTSPFCRYVHASIVERLGTVVRTLTDDIWSTCPESLRKLIAPAPTEFSPSAHLERARAAKKRNQETRAQVFEGAGARLAEFRRRLTEPGGSIPILGTSDHDDVTEVPDEATA
jgi:hypothetical protein